MTLLAASFLLVVVLAPLMIHDNEKKDSCSNLVDTSVFFFSFEDPFSCAFG